ncbi:pyruvate/2-oxoglutarate dehydrogenase complex dihydrolipoamide acyltransferase (E2) component [Nitrobacteraceae bacterium AZCC 1564]
MPKKDVRLVAATTAVGILVCFSTPEQTAAAPAKSTVSAEKPIVLSKFNKRRAHTAKKSRSARYARKSSSKSSAKKSDESKVTQKTTAASKPELPAVVANAHAEAPKPRTLAEDEARNLAALDSTDVVSNVDGVPIAASDQLNDVDRALTEESAPALVSTAAKSVAAEPVPVNKIIKAVPSGENPTVKKADDSDPWSKSSLLGKFFITFGGLLTLASAARIFIA